MDYSEASAIAFLPFKIVEQRPNKITAQFDASRDGLSDGNEMITQICDSVVLTAVNDLKFQHAIEADGPRHIVGGKRDGACFRTIADNVGFWSETSSALNQPNLL